MNLKKEKLFKIVLITIFVFCIGDIQTTAEIINHERGGIECEQNYFARNIIENYGIVGLIAYRAGITLLLIGFLIFLYNTEIYELKFSNTSLCLATMISLASIFIVIHNVNILHDGNEIVYSPWLISFIFCFSALLVLIFENFGQLKRYKKATS